MRTVDATHDERAESWIESANQVDSEFPPQNLPYGVFWGNERQQLGVGIGDQVLSLTVLDEAGLLSGACHEAVRDYADLTGLMRLSLPERLELRRQLFQWLTDPQSALAQEKSLRETAFYSMGDVELLMPVRVGDYTDFYASVYHATNVGSMFRPDNPLLPNWKHLPIGYHGRASSLVVSGADIRRPQGQLPPAADGESPSFGPCRQLDYELEVGALISEGNSLGTPVPLNQAESKLFGIVLVNDWSARDIQRWEYQPLGPFLAKSFATTLSPWVVSFEALEPFRSPAFKRPSLDPQPLPYLSDAGNDSRGGISIDLEVQLQTMAMRRANHPAVVISRGSFADMYWTFAQMLTHHSSNGCNLNPGDLIASGTVSGPQKSSRGCLMELTWDGEYGKPVPGSQRTPIRLPNGEERTFLADGDEVVIRGWCRREGFRQIGLGECRGTVK